MAVLTSKYNDCNKYGSDDWKSGDDFKDYKGNIVKLLVKNGADVNEYSDDGSLPLTHVIIPYRYKDIPKFLLKNGANPNLGEVNGKTAPLRQILFWTMLNMGGMMPQSDRLTSEERKDHDLFDENIQIIRLLRNYKADPLVKDHEGNNAFEYIGKHEKEYEEGLARARDNENNFDKECGKLLEEGRYDEQSARKAYLKIKKEKYFYYGKLSELEKLKKVLGSKSKR